MRMARQMAAQQDGKATARVELCVRVAGAIGEIPAAAWNACANPKDWAEARADATASAAHDPGQGIEYNPFISHEFLSAVEESKSIGGRTGWQARHLLVTAANGALLAAAPCYLKSHSRGEYVFDRG